MNEDNLLEVDYDIPNLNDLGFEEFEVMKIQFSNLKEVKLLASLGLMIIFLEQKMYLI